jgi:hypothetical protein
MPAPSRMAATVSARCYRKFTQWSRLTASASFTITLLMGGLGARRYSTIVNGCRKIQLCKACSWRPHHAREYHAPRSSLYTYPQASEARLQTGRTRTRQSLMALSFRVSCIERIAPLASSHGIAISQFGEIELPRAGHATTHATQRSAVVFTARAPPC